MFEIKKVNLQIFAQQITTTADLTDEMKTYYEKMLLETAEPNLVHHQFGEKYSIPKNGGRVIEFRKFDDLPKNLTALTEGVTPDGKKLKVGKIEATVAQYGDYVTLTDVLMLSAIDNNIVVATKKIGKQGGMTMDTVVRNVVHAGTNVQYYDESVNSRDAISDSMKLNVDCIRRAVRTLKAANADPREDNYFVGIIHPHVSYDLMSDPAWEAVKNYDPEDWYRGEIGRIAGVRFVESTEAPIFVKAGANNAGDSQKQDVYSTLIIGADAYGVVDVAGGGIEILVKQLGSAGSADPLDQRSTVGWKATQTAVILNQDAMVRIETASTTNKHAAN